MSRPDDPPAALSPPLSTAPQPPSRRAPLWGVAAGVAALAAVAAWRAAASPASLFVRARSAAAVAWPAAGRSAAGAARPPGPRPLPRAPRRATPRRAGRAKAQLAEGPRQGGQWWSLWASAIAVGSSAALAMKAGARKWLGLQAAVVDELEPTALRPEEMSLKIAHPHPRDDLVVFDAPTHTYHYRSASGDMTQASCSCTQLVHQCFPPFNADDIINRMMRRRQWPPEKYTDAQTGRGYTKEQIKAMWDANSLDARTKGTWMHHHLERLLNGLPPKELREVALFRQLFDAVLVPREIRPYRTEMIVFDEELDLAGSVDFVGVDDSGVYHIFDWKRAKDFDASVKLSPDSAGGLWPLRHLPNCSALQYSLQLNIYARLLTQNYGLPVGSMWLGILHPEQAEPLAAEVPVLGEEVDCLFALRRLEVKAAREAGEVPSPDFRHALTRFTAADDPLVRAFHESHGTLVVQQAEFYLLDPKRRVAWLQALATSALAYAQTSTDASTARPSADPH